MFIQLFKCYIYLGLQLYLIGYFCFSIPEGTGVILSEGDDPPFDDEDYSYFFTSGEINSTLIINDTELQPSLLSGNICLLCSMSVVLICKYLYRMLTPNILYFWHSEIDCLTNLLDHKFMNSICNYQNSSVSAVVNPSLCGCSLIKMIFWWQNQIRSINIWTETTVFVILVLYITTLNLNETAQL